MAVVAKQNKVGEHRAEFYDLKRNDMMYVKLWGYFAVNCAIV
jgi:hypothetical protein